MNEIVKIKRTVILRVNPDSENELDGENDIATNG